MSEALGKNAEAREREIFLGALEMGSMAERAAYIRQACAGDAALEQRIEALLATHEQVGTFLESPALSEPWGGGGGGRVGPPATVVLAPTEQPGDRIQRYKLLQKIGEGGCGVVYMAEQEEPVRRRVALKVIKLGMDTKSVIARFEAERQALAMMDHPNIAKVLDAGATDAGRPYFVMELVRGVKITEYCDQNHLPPKERLSLFIEVCQAIQHAHQKGIIHRDIKPSNILVTLHDGVAVPKVIDFGIAKATEQRLTAKTLFTEFSAFIGTPAYMSPEQAEMSGLDIDTRSDIYSLGVLLYELLTGKTPFDAQDLMEAGLDECRRTIREQEPVRPSTRLQTMHGAELTTTAQQRQTEALKLIHELRGDLDWIVMKCLEKDRTRRYATATGLGGDVQRYLDDEPVLARPPSNLYRLGKMLHRHRVAVMAITSVATTLLIGAGMSAWQAVRATRAERAAYSAQSKEAQLRRRAEQERHLARLNEYVADINLAKKNLDDGNYGKALQLLNKHLPKNGQEDLRGFEWRYLLQLCRGDDDPPLPAQDGPVQSLACSPDNRWLAVGRRDKLSIWDLRTRSLTKELPDSPVSMAFHPGGGILITGSPEGVRVWRTSDWTLQATLPNSAGPVALSSDGSRLATLAEGGGHFPFPGPGGRGVRIWDTATWEEKKFLRNASEPLAFSPDGQSLAIETRGGIALVALNSAKPEVVLQDSTNLLRRIPGPMLSLDHRLAFSTDGQFVVAPRNTLSERGVFVLSVWNAQTGEEKFSLPTDPEHVEHTGMISSVAFLPDGNTLVTASWDHSLRLWDFGKRQAKSALHGHLSEVRSLALFSDGQTIVSGSKDGAVKLWKTDQPQKEPVLPGWEPLAFASDSTRLAVYRPGQLGFLNLANGELEQQFAIGGPHDHPGFRRPPPDGFMPGPPGPEFERRRGIMPRGRMGEPGFLLTSDLRVVAEATEQGTVTFWNVQTHETNVLKVADGRVDLVALSSDASLLVTAAHSPAGPTASVQWWDLRTRTNGVLATQATRGWFSPNDRILALHQGNEAPELWDMTTHTVQAKLQSESPVFALAFSPDSRMVATTGGPEDPDNALRLWDTATGRLLGSCTGHKQWIFSVAFSPEGATLATASDDSTVKLWNVVTQQELLSTRRLGGGLRGLHFSPDGQWLVGGSPPFAQKGGIQFFHAPRLER